MQVGQLSEVKAQENMTIASPKFRMYFSNNKTLKVLSITKFLRNQNKKEYTKSYNISFL